MYFPNVPLGSSENKSFIQQDNISFFLDQHFPSTTVFTPRNRHLNPTEGKYLWQSLNDSKALIIDCK